MSGERGLSLTLAGPDDAADLAHIYASDDGFPGDVAVKFLRGADPLASLAAEGDRAVVPLLREAATGRPMGMGACVVRRSFVGGRPCTVGYLTGMKVVPEFRRAPVAMPRVYALIREATPEVDLYVTTILDENLDARRLLERGHRGMPEYRFAGHVTTYAFRRAWPPRRHGLRLTGGTLAELLALRGGDTPADLSLARVPTPVSDADVRLLRTPAGDAVAGCALWDQRATKQHVVTAYGGAYRWLSRVPVHALGYPRFPQVGAVTDEAAVVMPWARGGSAALLGALLREVAWAERCRDYLLVAGLDGGSVAAAMRGTRAVRYGSRLYTVHFPDMSAAPGPQPDDRAPAVLDPASTAIEVALL